MEDGVVVLWDVKKVMDNASGEKTIGKGVIDAQEVFKSKSPIGSLEFNPNKKNLIACGGAEVLIQDISS